MLSLLIETFKYIYVHCTIIFESNQANFLYKLDRIVQHFCLNNSTYISENYTKLIVTHFSG